MRFEDWPSRLARALDAAREKPFVWGSHDCCLWAADVVLALTGVDHAEGLRGTYDDARGALRALERVGGLRVWLRERLGAPVPLAYAQRGDVVLRPCDGWDQLGICEGALSSFTGERGLVRARTLECALVWRVD